MAAGLVKGEGFAVDASVMEANASRYHGKAPDEIAWAEPERQTRAVKEYLAALEAENEPNPDRKPPKVISPSDPCSAWTAKANKRVQFGYGLNYLIDIENAACPWLPCARALQADASRYRGRRSRAKRLAECPRLAPKWSALHAYRAASVPLMRETSQTGSSVFGFFTTDLAQSRLSAVFARTSSTLRQRKSAISSSAGYPPAIPPPGCPVRDLRLRPTRGVARRPDHSHSELRPCLAGPAPFVTPEWRARVTAPRLFRRWWARRVPFPNGSDPL